MKDPFKGAFKVPSDSNIEFHDDSVIQLRKNRSDFCMISKLRLWLLHIAAPVWWPVLAIPSAQEHPRETKQPVSRCAQQLVTAVPGPAPTSPAAITGPPPVMSLHGQALLLPNGCPLPGNCEIHSQLSQENTSNWDWFFSVLKLTLANVIAWCTDLSNLFSAAILKHIIIVYCVSKAGLGFHVTEL